MEDVGNQKLQYSPWIPTHSIALSVWSATPLMSCSLLFSLTSFACSRWFCRQISLCCSCKSGISSTSALSTFSIPIQAAMRVKNTTKFSSSITTLPFCTHALLKGFLKTDAATEADLTGNRLFSSSFAEPRTTHGLSGTLWQGNVSCAMGKS